MNPTHTHINTSKHTHTHLCIRLRGLDILEGDQLAAEPEGGAARPP